MNHVNTSAEEYRQMAMASVQEAWSRRPYLLTNSGLGWRCKHEFSNTHSGKVVLTGFMVVPISDIKNSSEEK